ncbi:MAG: hypothetical protein JXJ17_04300 [Anaerolineae bacterium]|nr:hypothetical protein [Anaerolineae bacterium]
MSEENQPSAVRPKVPDERNPETHAIFRREGWWQITFPVVAVSLLSILAIVLIAVLGGPGAASVVADYALGLIILLNLIAGLLIVALVIGAVYVVSLFIRKTPPYTYVAQKAVRRVYEWIDRLMNRIANIVIMVRSAFAGLKHYLKEQGYIPVVKSEDEKSPSATPQPQSKEA